MTGAMGQHGLEAARLREILPLLGLDEEYLLVLPAAPDALEESNLQAWSYAPEFTPIVQRLLQLRRGGGSFAVAVCGAGGTAAARCAVAAQLAVGFTQHGLGAVLVDADPMEPGLAGLVQDPHQEGLVDMVRFGRSCRALLHKPFPGAPSLLGMGSFPVQGELPFEGEAWRGIVHRIALHSELALYVAPVQVRDDVNPLLQAVEQVIYVASAADGESVEADVERLRRSTARVAAVVVCRSQATASEAGAAPLSRHASLRDVEPTRAEASRPQPAVTLRDVPAPEDHQALEVETRAEPPALEEFYLEPEPEEEGTPEEGSTSRKAAAELAGLRAGSEFLAGPRERDDPTRPPEEVKELRQRLHLGDSDFSYSHHGRYSRAPLYLFLLLVLSIGGFLGYAFYKSRRATGVPAPSVEAQRQPQNAPATGTGAARPPGQQQSHPAATGIDDAAAAREVAAQTPPPAPLTSPQTDAKGSAAQQRPAVVSVPKDTKDTAVQPPASLPQADGQDSATPQQQQQPSQTQPTQSPPAPGAGAYVVHVASYHKIAQAEQDIANLRKLGYEARAVRTDLGSKGIWFRVYVGSYPSKEAAGQAREAILKLPGYDGFAQVRRAPAP